MSDSKISALTPAGAITRDEILPLVQSGGNVRATLAEVTAVPVQTSAPANPVVGSLWWDSDAVSVSTGSIDWAHPVLIGSTPTTLSVGKHHIITETSADRTHTLPAVSGNTGQMVSIAIASTTTYMVTIDGSGSETIDGALIRKMHNNETAILLCDGTSWTKIGGNSIPMTAAIYMSNNQNFSASAGYSTTKLALDTAVSAPTVASMLDLGNYQLIIPRDSIYNIYFAGRKEISNSSNTAYLLEIISQTWGYSTGNNYDGLQGFELGTPISSGTAISAKFAYHDGSFSTTVFSPYAWTTYMTLTEIPQW